MAIIFSKVLVVITFFIYFGAKVFSAPMENLAVYQALNEVDDSFINGPISPIPQTIDLNPGKVLLGEQLFHDVRFSKNNTVSCASCHNLKTAGTVNSALATGINNQKGSRNAPTVFNTGYNFAQLWDGKFDTLEQQIDGPIHNPIEMDSNWKDIISKLNQVPSYIESFEQLYGSPITESIVKDAIATFERSLITPNSRFDQYLRGDSSALTVVEKEGYDLYSSLGCISCHQGVNMGGNLFQKIGLFRLYQSVEPVAKPDFGRYHITGDDNDKYVFKVPSLRNIAKTAPYFHDGSVATLEEAIEFMAIYQLGRPISPEEVNKISAFLHTLTGTYKGKPL